VTLSQFQGSPSEHGSASLSHSLIQFSSVCRLLYSVFESPIKLFSKLINPVVKKRDRGAEEGWKISWIVGVKNEDVLCRANGRNNQRRPTGLATSCVGIVF
jgi:hypothetical protein